MTLSRTGLTGIRPTWLVAVVGAVALTLALASPAAAEGPNAVRALPGCTLNELEANDDDSTDVVPIGFTANFYGTDYTELYVNNNGNVTFTDPLGDYTPYDFTLTGDVIIAPFLADVDTRPTEEDTEDVDSALVTYGPTTVDGAAAFCVNWVDVGYYQEHTDLKNSFQLLLIEARRRLRHRVQLRQDPVGDRRCKRRGGWLRRDVSRRGLGQRRR